MKIQPAPVRFVLYLNQANIMLRIIRELFLVNLKFLCLLWHSIPASNKVSMLVSRNHGVHIFFF